MSLEKAAGIVIKRTVFNDSDVILTIFSKEQGKIQFVAKGARKTKSPYVGNTQLFCYTDFVYYTGKNLGYVNQTELIESFYKIRNNLERYAIATYIIEIVLQSFEEEQREERVFNLLLYSLYLLNKEISNPKILLLTYQLKIAGLMGYAPNILECSICHIEINENYYCEEIGGFICGSCKQRYPYSKFVKSESIGLLKQLLYCPIQQIHIIDYNPQVIDMLLHIMNSYITYHIDKRLFSFDFLETI